MRNSFIPTTGLAVIISVFLLVPKQGHAADLVLPKNWTLLQQTSDQTQIVTAGTSKDGKRSAMLSVSPIPEEELQQMDNPLAEWGSIVTESNKSKGFEPKTEKKAKTSKGDVMILTAEKTDARETMQTFITIQNKTVIILRLMIKDLPEKTPMKDPELAEILKSWEIQQEPNPRP